MEESWHLSKGVTISTLFGLCLLVSGQIYQYGALNQKIGDLEMQISDLKQSRELKIDKEVVEHMLITRDVQIIDLKSNINDLKVSTQENQKILRQILMKLPHQ